MDGGWALRHLPFLCLAVRAEPETAHTNWKTQRKLAWQASIVLARVGGAKIRYRSHTSVDDLEATIYGNLLMQNTKAKHFICNKTAADILNYVGRS